MIRPATAADAAAIAAIYNHYVLHTVVTFEEAAVDEAEMRGRIADLLAQGQPWLVVLHAGRVAGYAYAARWKARTAYRHTVETTVYVDAALTRQGLGRQLYGALFDILAGRDLHAAVAGIALPNAASVALHEHFGMTQAAHFSEVGFKCDRWVDVGYWQRRL